MNAPTTATATATATATTVEAGVDWVPAYPRIEAAVHGHTVAADRFAPVPVAVWSGSITAHGTSRHVTAPDEQTLRAGIIAEAAVIAKAMRRPVRLHATTPDGAALLAVHPDGYVEPLPASGKLGEQPTGTAREAARLQARCRHCLALIRVGGRYCTQCSTEHPLQLTVTVDDPAAGTPAAGAVPRKAGGPLGIEVFSTTSNDDASAGWLQHKAEPEPAAVNEQAVPARSVSPVRGLDLPAGRPVRHIRPFVGAASVVVVGAHGGAGETTLAALFEGAAGGERAWPADPTGRRVPVLLCARTHQAGLVTLQDAVREWAAGTVPSIDLVGVVTVADAPGKLPRQLTELRRLIVAGAPRDWHVPWTPAWREHPPDPAALPKPVAAVVDEITTVLHQQHPTTVFQEGHHH